MKTASQAGWSLTWTQASSGFQFVTVRSIDASNLYAEFSFDAVNRIIVPGTKNDVAFFDLPLSVCQLMRYWFGTITYTEYTRALRALNWPV